MYAPILLVVALLTLTLCAKIVDPVIEWSAGKSGWYVVASLMILTLVPYAFFAFLLEISLTMFGYPEPINHIHTLIWDALT